MPGRLLVVVGAMLALSSVGCSFHKIVVNPQVADLDPGSVVIGQSTHVDVLKALGPPAPTSGEEKPTKNVADSHFIYIAFERREVQFVVPFSLLLPFEWIDERGFSKLVVEFDESGVVSDCYMVEDDLIWRPLQGEGSREDSAVRRAGGES